MAIISVTQVADGYQSSTDVGKREESRGFLVRAGSIADWPLIQTAVDPTTGVRIPQYGEIVDGAYPNLIAKNISISPRGETGTVFHVVVKATTFGASTTHPHTGDPKDDPAELDYDYETREEPWVVDFDDKPIVNSAGQPFDPKPQQVKYDDTLAISVNLAQFWRSTLASYRLKFNAEPFCFESANTVLFIGAKAHYRQGDPFVRVTGIFKIRDDGWQYRYIQDQGYAYLDADGKQTIGKGADGQPYNSPRLLDGAGHFVEVGGTDCRLSFWEYEAVSFQPLTAYFKL